MIALAIVLIPSMAYADGEPAEAAAEAGAEGTGAADCGGSGKSASSGTHDSGSADSGGGSHHSSDSTGSGGSSSPHDSGGSSRTADLKNSVTSPCDSGGSPAGSSSPESSGNESSSPSCSESASSSGIAESAGSGSTGSENQSQQDQSGSPDSEETGEESDLTPGENSGTPETSGGSNSAGSSSSQADGYLPTYNETPVSGDHSFPAGTTPASAPSSDQTGGNGDTADGSEPCEALEGEPAEQDQTEAPASGGANEPGTGDSQTGEDTDSAAEEAGAEVDAAAGDDNPIGQGNSYIAEITPDGLVDGPDTDKDNRQFTITFTELSDLTLLGSAQVKINENFSNPAFNDATSISATPGKSWSGELVDIAGFYYLNLWAESVGDYLGQGEWVSAIFTATTPDHGQRGIYVFETNAWTDHAGQDSIDTDPDTGDPVNKNNMAAGYSDPVVTVGIGINNVDELAKIGQDPGYAVDDHYVQTADIDLGSYLAADGAGYNDGKGWVPIGNELNPFTGSYNGNGHIIENLTTDRTDEDLVGLFAHTGQNSLLLNIHLNIVNVTGKGGVGGLVGQNKGTVLDSSVTGNVAGIEQVGGLIGRNHEGAILSSTADTNVEGDRYVGGLVGVNAASGIIVNSHAAGTVTSSILSAGGLVGVNETGGSIANSNATGVASGKEAIGGLVGYNAGAIDKSYASGGVTGDKWIGGLVGNNTDGTINSSYAAGNVTGEEQIGGLVGSSYDGTIENSHATGAVTGNRNWVGGLVGYISGTNLSSSYAAGNVTGQNNVGGLVGRNYNGAIDNSYATGNVTGVNLIGGLTGSSTGTIEGSHATGTVDGSGWVGGLVGQNDSIVENSHATGEVTGQTQVGGLAGRNHEGTIDDSYATGLVTGDAWVGGLVGINTGSVEYCNADGNVTGIEQVGGLVGRNDQGNINDSNATGDVVGKRWVGGLVGSNYGGPISDCHASGNVTGVDDSEQVGGLAGYSHGAIVRSYATGAVSGKQRVGGLVGNHISYSIASWDVIENCYATGTVTGDKEVGGLVGLNSAVVFNSYSIGHVTGTEDVGGLIGHNNDSVISSYYDLETSGQSDSGKGIPKTTEEMKQGHPSCDIYDRWDNTVWTFSDTDAYPVLGPDPNPDDYEVQEIPTGTFGGGSGTEADPYLIAEFLHLDSVRYQLAAYFRQTSDLDLTNEEWQPIGNRIYPFTGNYNGDGHEITNLAIDKPGLNYGGLFGYSENSQLTNVVLVNYSITGNNIIGSLVGANMGGTIYNCQVTGALTGNIAAGGLAGANIGGTIENSCARGEVDGEAMVGGLIGVNMGGSIENCCATVTVSGEAMVGGLIGAIGILGDEQWLNSLAGHAPDSNIAGSYAAGNVTGKHWVGGLIGFNYGAVENSYASGDVTGEVHVGGLVGMNTGNVLNTLALGEVTGESFVGGLVGRNDGNIGGSFAAGDVEGSSNTGALAGVNSSTGTIQSCYAAGDVTGPNGDGSGVGGLIGLDQGTTEDSALTSRSVLRTLSTYADAGWDITGRNGTFPLLGWQAGIENTWFMSGDPLYQWHTFLGSGSSDEGTGIVLDSAGNIYLVGYSQATWDGPGGQAPLNPYSGEQDITIIKLDRAGTYYWHAFYGSTDRDYAAGITLDNKDQSIYVSGRSPATFKGPNETKPKYSHSGINDIVVIKLTIDGSYLWHAFFGSDDVYQTGEDITVDCKDDVYILSGSDKNWLGPDDEKPLSPHSGEGGNIAVLKLDSNGNYQWHTFLGSNCSGSRLAFEPDTENLYVTGTGRSTWKGPNGEDAINPYTEPLGQDGGSFAEGDILIVKISTDGSYLWHTFHGSPKADYGRDIAVDSSGNVYLTGSSSAAWNGPQDQAPLNAFIEDVPNIRYILKLDSEGVYQWHTFYEDGGSGVALDADGFLYLMGSGRNEWYGPEGQLPYSPHPNPGRSGLSILKLDNAGQYVWHSFYGSSLSNNSRAIAAEPMGAVYLTGRSNSTWLGPGYEKPLNAHAGIDKEDFVIIKLGMFQPDPDDPDPDDPDPDDPDPPGPDPDPEGDVDHGLRGGFFLGGVMPAMSPLSMPAAPAVLVMAPAAPKVGPVQYLVILSVDPATGQEPLVTVFFVAEGTAADLLAVIEAYELAKAYYDEHWEEISDSEYAIALLDLAAAWAAILAREAALAIEAGEVADLDAAVEAYETAMAYLAEYGGYLSPGQLQALEAVLAAVAELLAALGAELTQA